MVSSLRTEQRSDEKSWSQFPSNHATNTPYCFPDDVAEESLEATMCDFLNTGTSHYRTLTNWDKAVVISNY